MVPKWLIVHNLFFSSKSNCNYCCAQISLDTTCQASKHNMYLGFIIQNYFCNALITAFLFSCNSSIYRGVNSLRNTSSNYPWILWIIDNVYVFRFFHRTLSCERINDAFVVLYSLMMFISDSPVL